MKNIIYKLCVGMMMIGLICSFCFTQQLQLSDKKDIDMLKNKIIENFTNNKQGENQKIAQQIADQFGKKDNNFDLYVALLLKQLEGKDQHDFLSMVWQKLSDEQKKGLNGFLPGGYRIIANKPVEFEENFFINLHSFEKMVAENAKNLDVEEKKEMEDYFRGIEKGKQEEEKVIDKSILDEINKAKVIVTTPQIANADITKYRVRSSSKDKSKQPILLISVHGTFSGPTEFGGNISMEQSSWYNTLFGGEEKNVMVSRLGVAIFRYAKELAEKYKNDVDFWVFQWSSWPDQGSRNKAAQELADVVLSYIAVQTTDPLLFSIAHSHGCNVVNMAARIINNDSKSKSENKINLAKTVKDLSSGINFEVGIHIASPEPLQGYPDLNHEKPFNFKELYHFYSTHDATQAGGSTVCGQGLFSRKLPCIEIQNSNGDWTYRIWNVRLLDNGIALNHLNVKWVAMEHVSSLITKIRNYYYDVFDLDANVNTPNSKDPLVTVRLLTTGPECGSKDKLSKKQKEMDSQDRKLFQKQYGYDIDAKDSAFTKVIKILWSGLCELARPTGMTIEKKQEKYV